MLCPQCNVSNASEYKFCKNCGAPLAEFISSSSAFAQSGIETISFSEADKTGKLIGQIIDERYRIESLIAAGGMGLVYRAKRLSIGDEVAVKILHESFTGDQAASDRFQREAQMAARLKHPNAVNVYDFGTTINNSKYLVMELVEGQSLRDILEKCDSLPLSTTAEITNQVCAALDEAHRHGIIHRDIKPDNIIVHSLSGAFRVKVLDFGIAKLRDSTTVSNLTQTGGIVGTPYYMSPEQCLGEELDQRSDVYSMGIVIYQMLCGKLPFNATVATAVVVQHVNQPPPPLREINSGIPPSVESVVLQALEKQRNARPNTAGMLANALSGAVYNLNQQSHYLRGSQPLSSQATPYPNNHASQQHIQSPGMIHSGDMPTVQLSLPETTNYSPTPVTGKTALDSGVFRGARKSKRSPQNNIKVILLSVTAFIVLSLLAGVTIKLFWTEKSDNKLANTKTTTEQKVESAPLPKGMVLVAGGEFIMGRDEGKLEDEKPAHKVSVASFLMDIYETTNEQYAKFAKSAGYRQPAEWKNGSYPNGQANFPVVGVNWEDANAFCKNAGKRLPTEEEWEFAARGPNNFLYPWGNDWKPEQGNVGSKNFAEVGKFKGASPFGIYDMVGNAGEWTASDFKAYPNGKLSGFFTGKTNLKTVRGGNIGTLKDFATAAYRIGWQASGAETYDRTGFRCVQDVEKMSNKEG